MHVVVIGGGAGGMMAAGQAASLGDTVTLLERNEKLGKKLYITGKGRCNITNNSSRQELLSNVVNNSKFLMSALSRFTPEDTIELCNNYGCPTKVERGNRVFPISDRSSDFIDVLADFMRSGGVRVELNSRVSSIIAVDGHVTGVKLESGAVIAADKVILATGGMSYPGTGSTGDGYKLAKALGHSIVTPIAALTPIDVVEDVSELAGVSLKNINCRVYDDNGKVLCEEFGEMLFTHTGLSGPVVLSLSSRINRLVGGRKLYVSIDLKPALSNEQLDARVLRDFDTSMNRELKNSLSELLISSLRQPMMERANIAETKRVNQISKAERMALVTAIKDFRFTIKKLGGIAGAIVTSGGISVSEVNPKNMESKLISGLHFAGEVLDIDALTGGYNIQIALSTGYVCGDNSTNK